MGLHARAGVLHRLKERRHNAHVLVGLDVRAEVDTELPHRVAGRPAHSRVRVLDALDAAVNGARDLIEQHLLAALGDLRKGDEYCMALSPVLVLE